MNLSRYLAIRESILAKAKEVEDKKRISYTAGDQNVLRNFVSDSEFVGTNQLQNCLTHFMKQVRGISSFVVNPEVEPSESLASRAADVINYVCLMVANAEEMGRDTGLGKKGVMYVEESIVDTETWKKLQEKPTSEWLVPNTKVPIQKYTLSKKPFDTDVIWLSAEEFAKVQDGAFDYNFGKDDV